jgi:DNA topoisomerase-1
MSYELIISEKPQAAEKIAQALAGGKAKKTRDGSVNFFSLKYNGKDIRVASAVGHLYGLGEKGGETWKYPVFETEWKAIHKTNKAAKYTADYIRLLTKLGKDADEVTMACDFDVEGEVIGLNVMRFALGKKDANRMKFSTLTKDELIRAYENKQKTLEWGQAHAGETRHTLDWYYGINLSRAFTQAIKKGTNQFKVLSAGRVQAPALHFLAERERKINAFKSEPFWEIYLDAESKGVDFQAQHKEDKIFEKDRADKIVKKTQGKHGTIAKVEARQFKQAVPLPFDLTSLQMEANTMFGFTPKRTLEIAQRLYVEGITSYPRTSSQKLPQELNLKNILNKLQKMPNYKEKATKVLTINPGIKPLEGKKTDPAHPAIYPTGEVPKKLEGQDAKLYDLIVKRFFAVFGKPAVRETNTVTIEIEKEPFIIKGTRTLEKNWHELYEPYLKFEEVQLPKLDEGNDVTNKKIESIEKETQPPKRYTQASIIKELEKRNIGTKATRAQILDNLYDRGYVTEKSIKVTELGMQMDDVLKKELPQIVDEELTRHFEEEMEAIREGKSSPEKILKEAKDTLLVVLEDVQKKEVSLGKQLAGANLEARRALETLGDCPKCEEGKIVIRRAKVSKKRFAGCNNYPNCKTAYPLPQMGKIQKTDETSEDGSPIIILLRDGKRPWKLSVNPEYNQVGQNKEKKEEEKDEKKD